MLASHPPLLPSLPEIWGGRWNTWPSPRVEWTLIQVSVSELVLALGVCTARIISAHRCWLSPCLLASLTADDSLEARTLSGRFSEALYLPGWER